MKIVIAAPAHPYRGGIAEFSNRLALQFQSEGHEINIVTFSLQYPGFLFPGKTQYTDSPAPEKIKITRSLNSVNPLNWLITGKRIKRQKPDILLLRFWLPFMGPCLGTVSRITRSNKHTKVVCIFDNVIPHEKRPGDKFLTRYFTKSIDGAIVMSVTVEDELKTFRRDIPIKLNPHPLFDNYGDAVPKEYALAALNLDPEFSYLLFFGFIRAYKGLDLLLDAFADHRLRNRKLKLLVAGEFYEDDAPYRTKIKEHRLENDVIIFNRFIRDKEVPLFFGAADLVVQPYKSATQSGVTQIAFHYEKPMLVTEVGGLKEIITHGKCGYVVKPDFQSIADSIVDFYDNNRKELFTEGVKQEKQKFTWDKMTGSIIEVYRKCPTTD
jgi:glycosyltransferase involved in cell wall biosynthesis